MYLNYKKSLKKRVKFPNIKKPIIGENIYILKPKIEKLSTSNFIFFNFLYEINRPLKNKICKT